MLLGILHFTQIELLFVNPSSMTHTHLTLFHDFIPRMNSIHEYPSYCVGKELFEIPLLTHVTIVIFHLHT